MYAYHGPAVIPAPTRLAPSARGRTRSSLRVKIEYAPSATSGTIAPAGPFVRTARPVDAPPTSAASVEPVRKCPANERSAIVRKQVKVVSVIAARETTTQSRLVDRTIAPIAAAFVPPRPRRDRRKSASAVASPARADPIRAAPSVTPSTR